jgi:murein DD-endopeptidase MepM/ murein hydrolase activator NlpD
VRYYGSHLSTIAPGLTVGQRVRVGTLLGYTGKSGNARFTPPHLQFGISQPTTPDDWQVRRGQISPYPYLTAWAQGESLTPLLDQ